jgi:glutathione S-transferase
MLRLHHAPLACSLASRLALGEAGPPHEVAVVRTWLGEQNTEAYRRINPLGKVPALETDEGVLTESPAILAYVADLAPERGLMPAAGTFQRAKAQSWLAFLASTLHPAMSAAMFPAAVPADAEAPLREAALRRVVDVLGHLEAHLEGRDHLIEGFSVCDLYLLVFLLWRGSPALAGALPSLPNLDRFQQRLFARPTVAAIVAQDMKARLEG